MRHRCAAVLAIAATIPTLVAQAGPAGGVVGTRAALGFHVRYEPLGATTLADVACPTATTCLAAGGGAAGRASVFRSTNGGASWTHLATPQDMEPIARLACATATSCLAVGAGPYSPYFLSTRDGGNSWTQWVDQDLWNESVTALACATATDCLAVLQVGELVRSTDGGVGWSVVRTPGILAATAVRCPSTMACLVAGQGSSANTVVVDRSTNGGAGFAMVASTPSSSAPSPSLGCASPHACAVAGTGTGTGVLFTTDGGTTWRSAVLPGPAVEGLGVSCTAAGCAVAASATSHNLLVATTTNRGAAWSTTSLAHAPEAADVPGGLSCTSRGACVATGFGASASTVFVRRGLTAAFRRIALPAGPGPLEAATCPSDAECVAVGDGTAVRSSDGGRTWSPAAGVPSVAQLDGVACATDADCVAVGDLARPSQPDVAAAYRSTDAGRHWQRVPVAGGHLTLAAVACATSEVCVAVSADGAPSVLRTTNAGASWGAVAIGGTSNLSLTSVACGSASSCVAVGSGAGGGEAATSADGGAAWSVPGTATAIGDYLQSVACSSATDCVADGGSAPTGPGAEATGIYASSDGGATWTATPSAPASFDAGALGCAPGACLELATPLPNYGPQTSTLEASTDGGSTWSVEPLPLHAILNAIAVTPSGRWVLVGTGPRNGALTLST